MLGAVTSTVQVDNAQGKTKRVGVFSLAAAGTFVYKTAYCLHFAFITLLRQKRRKLDFQSFGEDMEENEVGSRAETKFNWETWEQAFYYFFILKHHGYKVIPYYSFFFILQIKVFMIELQT